MKKANIQLARYYLFILNENNSFVKNIEENNGIDDGCKEALQYLNELSELLINRVQFLLKEDE